MSSEEIYWGSDVSHVIFMEVIPLIIVTGDGDKAETCRNISNAFIKYQLLKQTRADCRSIQNTGKNNNVQVEWCQSVHDEASTNFDSLMPGYLWQNRDRRRIVIQPTHVSSKQKIENNLQQSVTVPVYLAASNDPACSDPVPCIIKAYVSPVAAHILPSQQVAVVSSTLVRILPSQVATWENEELDRVGELPSMHMPFKGSHLQEWLFGEGGNDFLSSELQEEVLMNHNSETIKELSLRMSLQSSQSIALGTTRDSFLMKERNESCQKEMKKALESYLGFASTSPEFTPATMVANTLTTTKATHRNTVLCWEPSLVVYSPNHADGKTLLVQAIAKKIGCSRIHLIRPGPLFAKYGIYADLALESMLHGILVSAAAMKSDGPVCIILDQLDAIMPPHLSGRSSSGDAAVPVLNAIASHLRIITGSMANTRRFPFPVKNRMYNDNGCGGRVLSVRLCLVGIVTCPDDGWRSLQKDSGNNASLGVGGTTILDCLIGGRFRLIGLNPKTRLLAFRSAFQQNGIVLESSASNRLPIMAASAAWAKGSSFKCVADFLKRSKRDQVQISLDALEKAFAYAKSKTIDVATMTFQPPLVPGDSNSKDLFASVGGNGKAKESLEDALALDPKKRDMLHRLGLSPPSGILLYGPPGTGKTLLAKAVANLLATPTSNEFSIPQGGTFISLGSSDLVRAEIGTSEKMLVSAFDFAKKNAPSVIFLDEFQALFTERSRGGSGKLASTLMQCLDDMNQWKKINSDSAEIEKNAVAKQDRIVVLAATNTPWMIDSSFLRQGRFDRVVHVGLPSEDERNSILKVHVGKMKFKDDEISLEELCRSIAMKTQGYSGADLAALCRSAAIRCLDGAEMGKDVWVEKEHFHLALETDVHASSDLTLVGRLHKWKP